MSTTSRHDQQQQPARTGPTKFLFATTPLSGHVNPGLSIAHELVQRGHEVRWYTGSAHARAVAATGAAVEPIIEAYAGSRARMTSSSPPRRANHYSTSAGTAVAAMRE